MPPGPAYNWFCVLSSTVDILSHAAKYRATQLSINSHSSVTLGKRPRDPIPQSSSLDTQVEPKNVTPSEVIKDSATPSWRKEFVTPSETVKDAETPPPGKEFETQSTNESASKKTTELEASGQSSSQIAPNKISVSDPPASSQSVPNELYTPLAQTVVPEVIPEAVTHTRNLQSSKVPSSRIGRLFHYGGLAASLGYGAASELLRRTGSGSGENSGSLMMTEANIKRLVSKLSQMRGAALKLGQFLSIQDTHLLPPEVDKVFRRVQDSAHYMPDWQMEKAMQSSLGPEWMSNFDSFDRIPFAAASIGQVHSAVLAASVSPTGKPAPVAVKIQFPNIVDSISSDLGYINMLLTAGRLLPKGLFLDRTMQVMKQELAEECDYKREASFIQLFGSSQFLGTDPRFKVPWAWEGSTDRVLVMERVNGVSVGEVEIAGLSQEERNFIASTILSLCLKELFEFRMMQTDPNYTNFLYNKKTRQIELVDFGATREYSKTFMDGWLRLLKAAAEDPEDREACIEESLKLGYLIGGESQVMLDAHVDSMTLLATPFKASTPQPVLFGPGSHWEVITKKIREHIPVMLHNRLTPPPKETYSLNRKLSGAFLLASRLKATIDTKAIWDEVVERYKFDE
ncbi:ABC1-domain-containing protein [Dendrothele bispora CBS 962.96]|uniref:ABC1-domain-containing protein n=1 Tax=Dendrothele bispora (strain CBS 962.96) TaxID=1314807 RepID=A0A4S8MPZ1_DENBC|nr:ABC1-domain-containing protein [Dendrothele bispora CBS 962.96]